MARKMMSYECRFFLMVRKAFNISRDGIGGTGHRKDEGA
jgi:hypothetical protein